MTSGPTARVKVLFAIPSMGLGGSERVVLNLLRRMDPDRFELHLAVLVPNGERLQDVPAHVQVHQLGVRARYAVMPLARLCRSIGAQAVLSTSAHLNTALIAARPLLPAGTTLLAREGADIVSLLTREAQGRLAALRGHLRVAVYKRVYRQADVVICQSDYMKQDLVLQFGLAWHKAVRIYNPVDIEQLSSLAAAGANPFPQSGPNLVAVGRFSREKGFDILLRAMAFLHDEAPSASLTLVGDGPDMAMLRAEHQALGLQSCVHFAGAQRNPYVYMRNADLLVLPSRCEALPNVVLEALALGTPVVATSCTGAMSEIASCTRRLRVAREATPETLASEIVEALKSPPPRHLAPEPEFVAQFGAAAVTKQYERVILESVGLDSTQPSESASAAA